MTEPTLHGHPLRVPPVFVFLLLVGVAAAVGVARSPWAVFDPVPYAEDGVWAGWGLTDGWLNVMRTTRGDYLVVINLGLLWLATWMSRLVSGSPVLLLPQAIGWVGLGALASFFACVAMGVRTFVGRPSFYVLFAWLVLMRFGGGQVEILGRCLQLGFFLPAFSWALWMLRRRHRGLPVLLIDLLLLLCFFTNPLCVALCAMLMAWDWVKTRGMRHKIRKNAFLLLAGAPSAWWILRRLLHAPNRSEVLTPGASIKMLAARPILFPLCPSLYKYLTDVTAIFFTLMWAGGVAMAWKQSRPGPLRDALVSAVATLGLVDAATFVMRPFLSFWLTQYGDSGPGRYFMGAQVLTLIVTVLAVELMRQSARQRIRTAGHLLLGICALSLLIHAPKGFEGPYKTLDWHPRRRTFARQLCRSMPFDAERTVQVPIDPGGWTMAVPGAMVTRAQCQKILALPFL